MVPTGNSRIYRKHFIPLESNPSVFTELIDRLGIDLAFADIYSLDEPDLLAMVPRPALGLVLVFPTPSQYEQIKAAEEAKSAEYAGHGEEEDVVWFKQTIHNACGLYGILHCVSNGQARRSIRPNSIMSNLLEMCVPLSPKRRALALEDDKALEDAYAVTARQGDSTAPENPEDEVDFHYIAFVKSDKTGHLFQLDGDRTGPIDLGPILAEDDDLLSDGAIEVIRRFIRVEGGENPNFSLMALGPAQEDE
ncbi:ubiquitinyl hydrolase 1 [Tulasnella sp. 330]|nr:ubiquitinyl hydrolase 1 [Tulasnella sp. 330]KAG8875717.1 ubiquitinyl hydrolase 1 [Tulasnella sp. 331]